jgi:fructoselysine-6-P-deglycase FrlB-like protein
VAATGALAVGVDAESRDYFAPLLVLRNHLAPERGAAVQLVLNTPAGIERKADLFAALAQNGIAISDIVFMQHARRQGVSPSTTAAAVSATAPSDADGALMSPHHVAPRLRSESVFVSRPATDESRGVELIARRIAALPATLLGEAEAPLPLLSPATLASTRFVVTGTGSSEAHARYLVWLLTRAAGAAGGVSARFTPLSSFATGDAAPHRSETLVVFSQGVSPNAQLALRSARAFGHAVLFTSTTAADEIAAGRGDRAALLEELTSAGAECVRFPVLSEYTTLIRVIGPACGFLAAHRFVAAYSAAAAAAATSSSALLPPLKPATPAAIGALAALRAPASLLCALSSSPSSYEGGCVFVAAAPLAGFAHNLAFKFMEGLYWSCPHVVDLLSFSHGTFQQLCLRPQPVILLQTSAPGEEELVDRCLVMLRDAGLLGVVVRVDAPPELAVFGFEAIFNEVRCMVAEAVTRTVAFTRSFCTAGHA